MGLGEVLAERILDKTDPGRVMPAESENSFRAINRDEEIESIEINKGEEWSGLDMNVEGMKKIYTEESEAGNVSEKR
jgi:ASC-1-like (ASCH) protein